MGQVFSPQWKAYNAYNSDNVVISLQDTVTGNITSLGKGQAIDGLVKLAFPDDSNWALGNRYKIFVSMADSSGIYTIQDWSNKTFTITSSENDVILPSNFQINLTGDLSSSGAQRNFDGSLLFLNNILVSGSENYFVGQGGGCTINCDRKDSCIIKDQKWVDSINGGNCKVPNYISLTKKGIEEQIKNKEIKRKEECTREICYEIIEITKTCAIGSVNCSSTPSITRTLSWGTKGKEVMVLQQFLGLPMDGVYGLNTFRAVIKWQKENGLKTDGVFGASSRNKMNEILKNN